VELREPATGSLAQSVRALLVRIGPAVLLLAVSVLVVWAGSWPFSLWVALFGVLMAREWYAISFRGAEAPGFPLHVACLVIVLLAETLGYPTFALVVLVIGAGAAVTIAARAGFASVWAALGVVYTIAPLAALVWLRANATMPVITVLWLFCVVWATDTAALVAGRTIGGPPLAPRISPKKTWAGLAGGVAAAALVGFGLGHAHAGLSPVALAAASAVLAVVAQLGDLTESAFKRHFGVKDSSQLIPGQGGVLDRVDGLIFATLAVVVIALLRDGSVLTLGAQP